MTQICPRCKRVIDHEGRDYRPWTDGDPAVPHQGPWDGVELCVSCSEIEDPTCPWCLDGFAPGTGVWDDARDVLVCRQCYDSYRKENPVDEHGIPE